jgi:hypothetical protein
MLCFVQSWQQGAPMPTPGYGFACAAVGDRVFAVGGLRGGQDSLLPRPQVEAYDVTRDSWVTGFAPMPLPRWFVGGAVLDGKIYVIGGSNGWYDFRRVDRFDPATNHWDTVAPLPWPRSGLGACTFGGTIYAVGGYSAAGCYCYQRTVARFQPDGGLGHWEVVDSLNTPRTGLGVAVSGDRIYAVGGNYYSDLSSAEYYSSNEWRNDLRSMHDARSGLALVGYGEMLCAIGGGNRYGTLASVEMLNTAAGPWYSAEPLSYPRSYLGAAVVDNKVVAMGGKDASGIVNAVEIDSALFLGVEETPRLTLPGTRRIPTVITPWALLDLGAPADVYDNSGVLVARLPGRPGLKPGVYFLRQAGIGPVKVTVVR